MRAIAILLTFAAMNGAAAAAEINAFVATAIKSATDELLPPFLRANGHMIRAAHSASPSTRAPLASR